MFSILIIDLLLNQSTNAINPLLWNSAAYSRFLIVSQSFNADLSDAESFNSTSLVFYHVIS